uniref:Uncharacterized protein n=1 Tax=Arthonia kermesina TaxID=2563723 RepID=A0A4P8VVD1_9PEZI|nr:hypothetical protein [Arthonia kermesina]
MKTIVCIIKLLNYYSPTNCTGGGKNRKGKSNTPLYHPYNNPSASKGRNIQTNPRWARTVRPQSLVAGYDRQIGGVPRNHVHDWQVHHKVNDHEDETSYECMMKRPDLLRSSRPRPTRGRATPVAGTFIVTTSEDHNADRATSSNVATTEIVGENPYESSEWMTCGDWLYPCRGIDDAYHNSWQGCEKAICDKHWQEWYEVEQLLDENSTEWRLRGSAALHFQGENNRYVDNNSVGWISQSNWNVWKQDSTMNQPSLQGNLDQYPAESALDKFDILNLMSCNWLFNLPALIVCVLSLFITLNRYSLLIEYTLLIIKSRLTISIFVFILFILNNGLISIMLYSFAAISYFISTFSLSFNIVIGVAILNLALCKTRFFTRINFLWLRSCITNLFNNKINLFFLISHSVTRFLYRLKFRSR